MKTLDIGEIDSKIAKKVWKDFTEVTTNRPSKSDLKTMKYIVTPKGVEVNWGDYSHLGRCIFTPAYFAKLGMAENEFIDFLKRQGLSEGKKAKKLKSSQPQFDENKQSNEMHMMTFFVLVNDEDQSELIRLISEMTNSFNIDEWEYSVTKSTNDKLKYKFEFLGSKDSLLHIKKVWDEVAADGLWNVQTSMPYKK